MNRWAIAVAAIVAAIFAGAPAAANALATADLVLTAADSPDPVAPGGTVRYAMTLTNSGPNPATTVTVGAVTPAGTTFTSLAAPGGWTVAAPAPGGAGMATATTATVPAGSSVNFTLAVFVTAAPGATITFGGQATAETADPNAANNITAATTAVANTADLALAIADAPDPVGAGSQITYTLTLTNNGPLAAAGATVNAATPANTTFMSFAAPAGWTSSTPPPGGTGTVAATVASLPAGPPVTFTIVVRVMGPTPHGTKINLSGTTSTTTADPVAANNTATATTAVTNEADLTLTATDTPDPVATGATITYALTLANAGPGTATDVQLSVPTPGDTAFTSFTAPADWTTSTPPVGGTGIVTATTAAVPLREPQTFTLVVTTRSPGAVFLSLTATATTATPDPVRDNNTATTNTTVIGPSTSPAPGPAARVPSGPLPWTGMPLIRIGGLTAVLVGAGLLLVAAARSRRVRR